MHAKEIVKRFKAGERAFHLANLNLDRANLRGANLTQANLFGASLGA
jgi:uncharacterized protein YjbI with pentapeptide repeats